ncbi:MAG: septation ring formation regulator EzrA [Alicyclobacillus sp.]|nr:septation ring formation regulator EzrA [Alicyclobacillus sp.]
MTVRTADQSQTDMRPPVSIKGTKGGLLFLLDEKAPHKDIVEHLQRLLCGDLASLFNGPEVAVYVDYGARDCSREEIREILHLFLEKDNFRVREFGQDTTARKMMFHNHREPGRPHSIYRGTVRAGQQLLFDGDVVVIGDVNPGGEIAATGDIYVLGRLRGLAHAGCQGDEQAIIAAAEFAPMQLRIANWVSRAPETDGRPLRTTMEFAYLREDGMAVDKLMYVQSVRPEWAFHPAE